jgi:MFS family permease
MSIGYENIFRFPPYANSWRAISGEWPDGSWIERRSHRTPWRERLGARGGYWVVALALLMTMATSTIPTPLYVLYQRRDHFSSLMVSIVFAVYAGGVIASLFLVGHVSDWLGRRRVLATGLSMNVASALIFVVAPGLTGLLVARVISGFSIGLTTATATAYLSELHLRAYPGANRRRAQILAIAVNLGGIGFGPLLAGLLAQYAPAPLILPYVVVALALTGLALLVLATPETVDTSVVHPRWHPQRVVVPVDARRQFFAACFAGLATFAVYGVFSSLVPRFLADTMGITSHAVAGFVAFSVFASGAVAQTILSPLKPSALLRVGSPTLLTGLIVLVTGMWTATLTLFMIGAVVTGVGAGLIFRGALSTVSEFAPDGSRAEALAGFFLGVYVGLSVPVVALGVASGHAPVRVLMLSFVTVVAIAIMVSVRSVVRRGSSSAVSSRPLAPTVPSHFSAMPDRNRASNTMAKNARRGREFWAMNIATEDVGARRHAHRTSIRALAGRASASQSGRYEKECGDDQ